MGETARNLEASVVEGFGKEWARFTQIELTSVERAQMFQAYFEIFPWERLPTDGGMGADIGCGSGRWAMLVAPRVRKLYLVDASDQALEVAKQNLKSSNNIGFHHASVDELPFPNKSLDFAYSLGVLHHIPDTEAGIRAIACALKPGAPFLIYLYYAFDNRSAWYVGLWKLSDWIRAIVCRMPFAFRKLISEILAATVYFPISRLGNLLDQYGIMPNSWPLAYYRNRSFYVMRTDSLDRFGTKLERRFTQREIEAMLVRSGFDSIRFSEKAPFWCAVGIKGGRR